MKPSYFMSDLHLSEAESGRAKRVLELWASFEGHAETLYLVGDVFDFWLGHAEVVFPSLQPIFDALDSLVRAGTRVVLFSGNHDPQPGPYFSRIGVETSTGAKAVRLGSHSVWLEHGDLIDPRGLHHRLICRVARMPWVAAVGRGLPTRLTWRLSRWYAQHPHNYDEGFPRALLDEWLPEKFAQGHDVVVMGHYHRAVVHEAGPSRLFALGDWVRQRTYLKYDGQFQLLRDQGRDRPPVRLSIGDHGPDSAEPTL